MQSSITYKLFDKYIETKILLHPSLEWLMCVCKSPLATQNLLIIEPLQSTTVK